MNCIKLASYLHYTEQYGTMGLVATKAVGAYSAIPMRFGKIFITAPAIVLPNNNYNMLIKTQFLQEFNNIINFKDNYLSLLLYQIPLVVQETEPSNQKRKSCYIEDKNYICTLNYSVGLASSKPLLPSVPVNKKIPIFAD